ncbi:MULTISPECIES: CD3324 family protein [unclassified Lacrimispora]|uniref:CD3324 family protein n=1 Tax=unclassified Lacrimispora TaxID=2719232 RepID=UPI00376F4EB0
MKYKNASDILPDELLRELQKYIFGEALYVPSDKKRKEWGDGSGARAFYKLRNEEIQYKFFHEVSIEQLAEEYCLSVETIRKIVYK